MFGSQGSQFALASVQMAADGAWGDPKKAESVGAFALVLSLLRPQTWPQRDRSRRDVVKQIFGP